MEPIFLKLAASFMIMMNFFSSLFLSLETPKPIFSDTFPLAVVDNLWIAYRDKIQKDGRTLDRDRNFITTSEGQSYALLRAVWMDDKITFDRVLRWTNSNLGKRDDELFAWKWGQNANGSWDILKEEGGLNSAADADQDIALALIFASKRWNQGHYLIQARKILNDIWDKEVVFINGRPYLVAGNWAKEDGSYSVNPSYFMFYAYPIFVQVNPVHDWLLLKTTSYEVLNAATNSLLDREISADLPPDWVSLDPKTGQVVPPHYEDKKTDFSDDAFRVPWRVALDWEWHQDSRAKNYLDSLKILEKEWRTRKKLFAAYSHDGQPLRDFESSSMYAATYPYFKIIHPNIADQIYKKKLASLYDPDTENFRKQLGYYAQNWVWFGIAFQANRLPNLSNISNPDQIE